MSKLLDRIKEAVAQHSIDELSTEMLASYKKKAGEQASEADKKGDFKKGNKRFSGIMKATRKQFNNDTKNESVDVSEAGPFNYGAKTPRKGSSAYEAMMKRKEQDKNYKPIEPKDNMRGIAKLTKEGIDEAYVPKIPRLHSAQRYKNGNAVITNSASSKDPSWWKVEGDKVVGHTKDKNTGLGWTYDYQRQENEQNKGAPVKTKFSVKEETEALDELSKKTLGSYYNKASADSYEHSRKSLDAFDKGDKEKDDYHFKKMNKREIGKMKSIARSPHTNESITESHNIGDSVIVRTSEGDKPGKVNDITKTHVGVHHPGIRGIIHYHPDYVKKAVKEAVDDTLIEGVSWDRWSKLNESIDKANSGQWMVSKHQTGYQYGHRDGVDHIKVHGTGKDAAVAGSNWAKEQGLEQVYVLESFIPKNVKNDIPFGAIVNSALTTVSK